MASHPLALAASVAVGAAASVVLSTETAGSTTGPVGLALLGLLAVPAAMAGGTDPAQRHRATVLLRLGVARPTVWAAALLAATLPVTAAGIVALALTSMLRPSPSIDHGAILWPLVLLPALGASLTAGARFPGDPSTVGRNRPGSSGGFRTVGGFVLVGLGAALPTIARSGSTLDLVLPLGTALVLAGLTLAAPGLLGAMTGLLGRLPWTTVRLGAAILHRNRRALTLPVALTAAAACVLVVQGILGVGLGRREADRVAALGALGPATAGTSDHQVLFPTVSPVLDVIEAHGVNPVTGVDGAWPDPFDGDRTAEQQALVTATYPGAHTATIETVYLYARAGDPAYGSIAEPTDSFFDTTVGSVAVASPELLTVLGLDPNWSTGDRAIALDPRALRSDATVLLYRQRAPSDAWTARPPVAPGRVPARASGLPGVPALLPEVLVPLHLLPDEPRTIHRLVALLPEVPDATGLAALEDPIRGAPTRGDQPVDLAASSRTDRMTSVWVRTSAEVWGLLPPFLLAALAVHWIAQTAVALAHRHEDEVLDALGAGPRHRVEHGLVRGAIVGLTAVTVGAFIGGTATAVGLAAYNIDVPGGRAGLAPIPIGIPLPVVVGLAALVASSAAVGALVGALRRRSDPVTRAERLAT